MLGYLRVCLHHFDFIVKVEFTFWSVRNEVGDKYGASVLSFVAYTVLYAADISVTIAAEYP